MCIRDSCFIPPSTGAPDHGKAGAAEGSGALPSAKRRAAFLWLATAFAFNGFIVSVLTVHLITILQGKGLTLALQNGDQMHGQYRDDETVERERGRQPEESGAALGRRKCPAPFRRTRFAVIGRAGARRNETAVSYTHLTLPTSDLV